MASAKIAVGVAVLVVLAGGVVTSAQAAVSGDGDALSEVSGVGGRSDGDPPMQDADAVTVVPSNWSLIPAGLSSGDEFRLLAKTKNPLKPPDTASSDIADYNGHVQAQVLTRGHLAVRDYAGAFRVLGSTATVNARTNTGTTGSGGVPIYWLNGKRVAADYGDFYDGTWENKNQGRGVAGDSIAGDSASGRQLLCTGTADDGTTTDRPLGGGDPDGDGVSECTATSIAITSNTFSGDVVDVSGRARFLALSNVFRVGEAVVPRVEDLSITSDPGSDGEYTVGDEIRIAVTFSEAVTVTGEPQLVFRMDGLNSSDRLVWPSGKPVQRKKRAAYDADASSSTELVFAYTVRSVDFDRDGIRLMADSLDLNGGTIRNSADDADADLAHPNAGIQSEHKIHVPARATGASVVSTPSVGTSFSTGETITIEVAFDRNVKVLTDHGTPSYELRFGVPNDTGPHLAPFARVVDGNKVQFDYVVQAGDRDPDGFVAHNNAIHFSRGIITRAEVHSRIALGARAVVNRTALPQEGHAVNA